MNRPVFKVIACFYLVFLSFILNAQESPYHFEHLTVNDGLSQSHVQYILQDSKGYMWFATRDGLNKWDGCDFKIYRNDANDTNSISGNRIESIVEDKDGILWIATFLNGLCSYDRSLDKFTQYKLKKEYAQYPDMLKPRDLAIDDKGNLWVFFQEGVGYKNRNEQIIRYTNRDDFFGVSFDELRNKQEIDITDPTFYSDAEVELYIKLCQDSLINTLTLSYLPNSSGSGEYKKIFFDINNDIWFGAQGKGLFQLDQELNIKQYHSNYIKKNQVIGKEVRDVIMTQDSLIWVGTDGDGIHVLNLKNQQVSFVRYNPSDDKSLAGNAVYRMYQDNTGIIWIGHFNDGISFYNKQAHRFETYCHQTSNPNSISPHTVLCIYEDSKQRIWIGTDGGGLNLFDKKTKQFKHFTSKKNKLTTNVITAIHEDNKGNLLLGTWNGGMMIFNPELERVMHSYKYAAGKSPIPTNHIWAFEEDKNGLIWLGALGNTEVNYYNPASMTFGTLSDLAQAPRETTSHIMTIMEDSEGNMWYGTEGGGVYKHIIDTHELLEYKNNPKDTNSLIDDNALTLYEDSKGNIWMGTQCKGVSIYNPQTHTFKLLNKDSGLPSNVIQGVVEDEKGSFWISTSMGICRYNPTEESFEHYNVKDGLQSNEFKYNATYKDKEGYIYMGGMAGLNIFHPKEIKRRTDLPPVYLSDFELFNESMKPGGKNSPLTKTISETDTLILNYKQNVFAISFVALNYNSPQKSKYKYKMQGFDEDYIETESVRRAAYMNLKSGEYTFHVMASNNDGVWNKEGANLLIIIRPPWWKKIWFRISLPFIVIFIIVGYYSYALRLERKNNEKLDRKVTQRTKELETKNEIISETNLLLKERQQLIEEQTQEIVAQRDELLEANSVKDKLFSLITHDLKGPFGAVMGLSELLSDSFDSIDDEKRRNIAGSIKDASNKVYDLLESLLYWSRAQRGDISPTLEDYNIIEILNNNIELAQLQADKKDISIISNYISDEVVLKIDKDLVDIVVRNLLSNAVKFTNEQGQIEVVCTVESDKLVVKVIDNGVGLSKEDISKLLNSNVNHTTLGTNDEKGTGLGFAMSRQFIELLGGKMWVNSKENEGSEFCFSL